MRWPKRALLRSAFSLSGIIKLFLLVSGILALICSVIFTSSVLAFIGLGLTFWGVLLSYLTGERYTRSVLLDSAALPSLEVLCEIIAELDYKGKAVYLPPKYLKDFKSGILYVPKKQDARREKELQKTDARREKELLKKKKSPSKPKKEEFEPPRKEKADMINEKDKEKLIKEEITRIYKDEKETEPLDRNLLENTKNGVTKRNETYKVDDMKKIMAKYSHMIPTTKHTKKADLAQHIYDKLNSIGYFEKFG